MAAGNRLPVGQIRLTWEKAFPAGADEASVTTSGQERLPETTTPKLGKTWPDGQV